MAFAVPVVEKIGDKEIAFPKLVMDDYAALLVKIRFLEKERIDKAVSDKMISAEDGKQFIQAIVAKDDNIYEVLDAWRNPKMVVAILKASWDKIVNPEGTFAELIVSEDPDLLASLAFRVTHRAPVKAEEP